MARKKIARKINTLRPEFRRAAAYWGLSRRVASDLGLDHSHVWRVLKGERASRAVEEALLREIRKIERAA